MGGKTRKTTAGVLKLGVKSFAITKAETSGQAQQFSKSTQMAGKKQ